MLSGSGLFSDLTSDTSVLVHTGHYDLSAFPWKSITLQPQALALLVPLCGVICLLAFTDYLFPKHCVDSPALL